MTKERTVTFLLSSLQMPGTHSTGQLLLAYLQTRSSSSSHYSAIRCTLTDPFFRYLLAVNPVHSHGSFIFSVAGTHSRSILSTFFVSILSTRSIHRHAADPFFKPLLGLLSKLRSFFRRRSLLQQPTLPSYRIDLAIRTSFFHRHRPVFFIDPSMDRRPFCDSYSNKPR